MSDRVDLGRLREIERAIAVLEGAIRAFEGVIGPPIYIQEEGGSRFKYPAQSPAILIVLKAVRVVSGLNALDGLLRIGHTVEMGVIIRTVDDFLGEIMFVEEAVRTGRPTADQQRFIEQFFAEEVVSVQEMMASDSRGPRRVERRAIQASEARILGAHADSGPGGRVKTHRENDRRRLLEICAWHLSHHDGIV